MSAGHPARSTARLADKGTRAGINPALMRRTIDGMVTVTGCRRKEARERINGWLAGGKPLSELEAWLKANYKADPTGVTAVRNADRPTGCPAGCPGDVHEADCPTKRPIATRDGHCCGSYGVDQLTKGIGCPRHRMSA